ncbi:hypothetical protein JX009_000281 [Listeria monocytogenes]|nr:hypothetical protein [Listeria monocytogenes]
MPYEKGGRSDKNGNRFEIRWIVYQLLSVLEEKLEYVALEALGEEEKGIDVWIGQKNGMKEGQQCKGRNGSKEYWDFGSLNDKNIFENWKYHLDRDELNTVSLVSPLAFTYLEDLIQRAKSGDGSPSDFYSDQILTSSRSFIRFFDNFCKAMSINTQKETEIIKCISYLKRIAYRQIPDTSLKEMILDKIKYLLIGDEEKIYSIFSSWVLEGDVTGKRVSFSIIKAFLKDKNVILRNLAYDERIAPRINELNIEYENNFSEIDNKLIFRSEFLTCRNIIDSGESVIIHGKAGRGKSGCTVDIINYCKENTLPYIAIKLDQRTPKGTAEEWARKIGLPVSIAHCIHSISKNKNAVIILDQLDALRWTRSHSREALLVCEQIIGQVDKLNVERKHNISIIFVCRSYDLENDNNISHLFKEINDGENKVRWNKVHIKELDDEIIRSIIGEKFNQLTNKLKEVLKIPSNLYIWKQLDPQKNYAECASTSHLVREWWNQLSEKCYMYGLDETELNKAKSKIVGWLENRNRIYFPLHALDINKASIEFLSSNSFLTIQGDKASFAHQSILDCFLAEGLSKRYFDGENVVEIVGARDKQTPGKRYQIQMFLEMLLEFEIQDFLEAGQEIFESDQIRFSIKFVFLEILNQVECLDDNIKSFIIDKCEDEIYEKHLVNSVLMAKPQYVRLLREKKVLKRWFRDPERRETVFNLLLSVSPKYTKEDIVFIEENAFQSEGDDFLFLRCFPYDINEDTDELFELRMKFYEKYPKKAEAYFNVKSMMGNTEMRAVRVVTFLLKNKLKKYETDISMYEEELFDFTSEINLNSGIEVVNLLVSSIPATKDIMLTINEWSGKNNNKKSLERASIQIVKKANAKIISTNPQMFWEYYQKFMGKGFYLFDEILLDGFTHLPETYSDLVIEYLIHDIERNMFVLTDGSENELSLAKKVLIKHAENCSQKTFNKLESKILRFIPSDAKERYKRRIERNKAEGEIRVYWSFIGDLQKELLEVLPSNLITTQTSDMIKVLNRKFPNGTRYSNMYYKIRAVNITNPIPDNKLNNNQWLEILTNKKIKRRESSFWNGDYVDRSIGGFSDSFRNAVSQNPKRMIMLTVQHKQYILDEYIEALFIGVSCSKEIENIPTELLENMILTFSYDYSSRRADYICDIIRKNKKTKWSQNILDILNDIAVNHKDPEMNKVSITNDDKEMRSFKMLQSNALNCVRGSAAQSIGQLLWDNSSLFEHFRNTIELLVVDENPAVKFTALFALIPSYNIDSEWTSKHIISLYEQDYRIAGFYRNKDMLFHLYPLHRQKVISIIEKCFKSEDEDLVEMGAYCLGEMFILNDEFTNVLNNIDILAEKQAIGILEMASIYFDIDNWNEKAKEMFLKFKNSELDLEIPISKLFYKNLIKLKRDKAFLIEVMNSNISRRTVHSFVNYLEKESNSIIDYKDIVISLSYQIIENWKSSNDNWEIGDEITKLIVGLYDETSDSELGDMKKIAEECLNLWDLMFENQVGSIRRLSQEIMAR